MRAKAISWASGRTTEDVGKDAYSWTTSTVARPVLRTSTDTSAVPSVVMSPGASMRRYETSPAVSPNPNG